MTKLQTPQRAPVAPRVRDVILRDGSTLRLRPPSHADLDALTRFFGGLSTASMFLRFHGFASVGARASSHDGRILRAPRGSNGFGYDPLFFIDELSRTTAELPPDEKHRISHRGKALRRLSALMSRAGLA